MSQQKLNSYAIKQVATVVAEAQNEIVVARVYTAYFRRERKMEISYASEVNARYMRSSRGAPALNLAPYRRGQLT
jgi:hypothetical protein